MAFQKMFEIAMEHLDRSDPNICSLAICKLEELLFPNEFERKVKLWITKCNCTRVIIWGQQVLLKNLKIALAMHQEGVLALGLSKSKTLRNKMPIVLSKTSMF